MRNVLFNMVIILTLILFSAAVGLRVAELFGSPHFTPLFGLGFVSVLGLILYWELK